MADAGTSVTIPIPPAGPVGATPVGPAGATPVTSGQPEQARPTGGGPSAEQIRQLVGPSGLVQFNMGVNAALADILETPGNAITGALNALGINTAGPMGSREVFANAGLAPKVGEEPDTREFAAGRMVGSNLPFLLAAPGAQGLRPLQAGGEMMAQGARTVGPALREGLRRTGETVLRAPTVSFALESAIAALSGVGGFEARQRFPEDPETAELLGQLAAGLAPVGLVAGPAAALKVGERLPFGVGFVTRTGANAVRQIVGRVGEITTIAGARRRAEERIGRAVTDVDEAARRIQDPETLPEARLTPAQRTQDPGLLALEKSIIESSDSLRMQSDQQIADLNAAIQQSLEAPPLVEELTKEQFEAARTYLRSLLDARLKIAGMEAEERIAALGPDVDEITLNTIAREEIDNAELAARNTERNLYAQLPADLRTRPTMATQYLSAELRDRAKTADPSEIPGFVSDFLGRMKGKGKSRKFVPSKRKYTFDDIRTLRSRVLQEIREEQAKKAAANRNKIRILDNIQDALLADLTSVDAGEAEDQLRTALRFSFDVNERFRRGVVGRIRGRTQAGELIPPALTLSQTIGMRGPKAAINARQILEAVRDGPETMRETMSDFIKGKFLAEVVRGGQIDETKAINFGVRNSALLDEFPEVRDDLLEAVRFQSTRNLVERRAERTGARLANPRASKAELFIQRDANAAFEAARKARDPGLEMQNLVNMAARDTSGQAGEGLEVLFTHWLLQKSLLPSEDVAGRQFVSGARLQRALNDRATQQMMARVLTKEQMERLSQTAETARALDRARGAREAIEGIIADSPNVFIESLARIGTLRGIARISGGFQTIQVPGMISNRIQDLLEARVKDPAARLLTDAITADDPELFLALLTEMRTPQEEARVRFIINSWLGAVLFESGLAPQNLEETSARQPVEGPSARELRRLLREGGPE